jgi:bifunctional DNA-binding transcriptional regulator/antitoxin component of YhaV-PrlF toxin-antitoxin module
MCDATTSVLDFGYIKLPVEARRRLKIAIGDKVRVHVVNGSGLFLAKER